MKTGILLIVFGMTALASPSLARESKASPVSPKGDQGSWFPFDSYPVEAKRRGETGRVSVMLNIDKKGTPTSCAVASSSGSSSLDAATCDLALANARFNPARDEDGKAVEARFWLRGVRWELYDDDLLPPFATTDTARNVEIDVDERGRGVTCRPLQNALRDDEGCQDFIPGGQVVSPVVRSGKSVKAKVTLTVTVRVEPE